MPAFFYEYIRENLPEVHFNDATDLVDDIKIVKSQEEIDLIRKTVELHANIFEATLVFLRLGAKVNEKVSSISASE
ncbi:MAG: Creatinase [Thermoproteota archaeon]|nr:Creatinase [Thermoproteota archaeon]